LEATKTVTVIDNNGDGNTGSGDTIVYTITVANTGGITLSNISLAMFLPMEMEMVYH
jgi:uncharacterized repeat protein (TIGR01451 family)